MKLSERLEGCIIALTGATGFLGGHILDALVASGARVRCLVRSPAAAAALALRGAEPILGDLVDAAQSGPASLGLLVANAQAVIHCAGLTKARNRDEFARANIAGTARLAAASRAAGVERYVQMSSLAAMQPGLSDYAASKFSGEEAAMRALSGHAGLVILRPPAIFGPGDREMAPLWAAAGRGVLPAPQFPSGGTPARLAIVYVADVVSAVLATVSWPTGTFSLNDGRPHGYQWPELAAILARVHGRPVRLMRIPRFVLTGAGHFTDFIVKIRNQPQVFGSGKVREMLHPDWTSPDDDLARTGLWKPAWDFERGLRATLQPESGAVANNPAKS